MPTSPYHHGHLRQALIEAAVQAVREGGPTTLSLRELARRVGVSHNAAYRHFADRDALVEVVAEQTMRSLAQAMQRRLDRITTRDPLLRARLGLAETGRGYVEFALAEPGLFSLTFAAMPHMSGELPPESDPYALLGRALDELVAVGFLSPQHRPGAEITCWAAVHGFSVLHIDGPLRGSTPTDRDLALQQVLETIDLAYAATSGTAIGPHDLRSAPSRA